MVQASRAGRGPESRDTSLRLADRVAIVTGSSRGIGRTIAERFAQDGARVVTNSRHALEAQAVAEAIRGRGGEAIAVGCDVARASDVETLAAATLNAYGQIDILVNNAGIQLIRPSEDLTEAEWSAVLATNLTGPFLCCRTVGRYMLERGRGAILNISSVASRKGFPMRAPYGVSKAGLEQLTRTLASEWAARGVRVNALAPGYVETDMIRQRLEAGLLDRTCLLSRIPAGELGRPEDVAAAATFLVSDEACYVNGATLDVDGGWSAFGHSVSAGITR